MKRNRIFFGIAILFVGAGISSWRGVRRLGESWLGVLPDRHIAPGSGLHSGELSLEQIKTYWKQTTGLALPAEMEDAMGDYELGEDSDHLPAGSIQAYIRLEPKLGEAHMNAVAQSWRSKYGYATFQKYTPPRHSAGGGRFWFDETCTYVSIQSTKDDVCLLVNPQTGAMRLWTVYGTN